eukprot:TRINITY_DN6347_c0_g1_i1.p1 TRINITY_DN6347_c0_g1~~TRINITY_DN6347_c0_g1_i1.p1  ORF type:complete len:557 (-),score=189.33 TRINITY_DN6347_c0_g1_i1:165-1835(-)
MSKKKVTFNLTILGLDNLFPYEGKQLYMIFKRGSKKENAGKTPLCVVNKNACTWKVPININATLYPGKGPSGFKPKLIKFNIRVWTGNKGTDIAKCSADLGTKMSDEYIPLEWLEKPGRSFESLMKNNPAKLHIKVESNTTLESKKEEDNSEEDKKSNRSDKIDNKDKSSDDTTDHTAINGMTTNDIDDDDLLTARDDNIFEKSDMESKLTGNANKDIKNLEKSNKKMRERIIELENKKATINKKLLSANARIKVLEKQIPKNNIKDVKSQMKDIQKEINDMSTVESTVTEELLTTLRKIINRSDNFKQIAQWMGWLCNCHIILANETGASNINIAKMGIELHKKERHAVTPIAIFLVDVETEALKCYNKCLTFCNQMVDSYVSKKVNSKWGSSIEKQDSVKITSSQSELCSKLSVFLDALDKSSIPHVVINQFIYQVFYSLHADIFNAIMMNPTLISFNLGIQLKIFMSELENWVTSNKEILYSWNPYKTILDPLNDLSNVLVIDKTSISGNTLTDTFPHLSPLQVKYLLDVYSQYNPNEDVPSSVIKDISRSAM